MTSKGEPDIDIPIVNATVVATAPAQTSIPAPTVSTTTTTVIPPKTTTTVITPAPRGYGRESCATTCPNCRAQVRTRVSHQADAITIVAVIVLLLLFWPLFWLPLSMPSCKSTEHYCPACNFRISREEACS